MRLAGQFSITVLGNETGFGCAPSERVLVAMEQAGQRTIPVGCRGGGCGLCRVRVCEGKYRTGHMSAAHITEQDAASNHVLACRLYPLSDLVLQCVREKAAV